MLLRNQILLLSMTLGLLWSGGLCFAQTSSDSFVLQPPPHKGYVGRYKAYRYRRHERHSQELSFNPVRRDLLMDLLFSSGKHHDLIDESVRTSLRNQSILPPGLKSLLVRGKTIPQKISQKMIVLPVRVNEYLGLTSQEDLRIGVLGNDVLMYNPNSGFIYDIMQNIF